MFRRFVIGQTRFLSAALLVQTAILFYRLVHPWGSLAEEAEKSIEAQTQNLCWLDDPFNLIRIMPAEETGYA